MSDELLLNAMAERDPTAFATALVDGRENEEVLEMLALLPDRLAGRVLSRLPQSRLRALATLDGASLGRRLGAVDFETALHLTGRLPRERALALVRSVEDRRLKRRLLQQLSFPEHSVGGLMPIVALQLPRQAPIEQVLSEVRELGSRSELPIVVVDDERRYLGKLDLWKLLTASPATGVASEYLLSAPGLHPETSLEGARELRVWDVHSWLAVITHERRVLGAVNRRLVFGRASRAKAAEAPPAGSFELVAGELVRVSGDLLTRLLGLRSR